MPGRSMAVVGAGAAGLGAAYALSGTDVDVTVLEASEGVGGRVVTRRREDYRYDTGANYITPADGRMAAFLSAIGEEGLVEIAEPVWTFDAAGDVSEGDPNRQDEHKWTYESGIATFADRLVDRIDAEVRTGATVDHLDRRGAEWDVLADDGEVLARADGVLLTPPAPRAASILGRTAWDDDRLRTLLGALDDVPYRTVVTLVLGYPFELDRPYYALVNTDREHSIGWLSREECKPGHVPDGESVLIAQMSPGWSERHYAMATEDSAERAAEAAGGLLDDGRLGTPAWTDRHRFAVALPNDRVDGDVVRTAEPEGLFIAGDGVVGEGRVSSAFLDGVDAGRRIGDRL